MKIEIHSKPIQSEYIVLERGKRAYLHPKLKLVDDVDCVITYNIPYKFFIVDYKFENGKYTKTLISDQVDLIIEILFEK